MLKIRRWWTSLVQKQRLSSSFFVQNRPPDYTKQLMMGLGFLGSYFLLRNQILSSIPSGKHQKAWEKCQKKPGKHQKMWARGSSTHSKGSTTRAKHGLLILWFFKNILFWTFFKGWDFFFLLFFQFLDDFFQFLEDLKTTIVGSLGFSLFLHYNNFVWGRPSRRMLSSNWSWPLGAQQGRDRVRSGREVPKQAVGRLKGVVQRLRSRLKLRVAIAHPQKGTRQLVSLKHLQKNSTSLENLLLFQKGVLGSGRKTQGENMI